MSQNISRSFCFTDFTDIEPIYEPKYMRYIIYQREKTKEGKEHWQGYVELYKPMTLKRCQKLLGYTTAHLEKRRGTRDQARKYCMKEKSRVSEYKEKGDWNAGGQGTRNDLTKLTELIEEGYTDYDLLQMNPEIINRYMKFIQHARYIINEENSKIYIKENYTNITLNKMQNEVIEHMNAQDDRKITWVYDEVGNSGKTYLSKHLIAAKGAVRFTNGRTGDIAFAYNNEDIIIFDFARSCEERINYQIIEDLKNGILFSSKYNSKCKIFNPPKIVIMANFMPNLKSMSEDRWDIIIVDSSPTGRSSRVAQEVVNS